MRERADDAPALTNPKQKRQTSVQKSKQVIKKLYILKHREDAGTQSTRTA